MGNGNTIKLSDGIIMTHKYFDGIKIIETSVKPSNGIGRITYIYSPTGNCQMASMRNSFLITFFSESEIKNYLKSIFTLKLNKPIILLDVKNFYLSDVINKLSPYCKKIHRKSYISSNLSEMTLLMCYLDWNKILK